MPLVTGNSGRTPRPDEQRGRPRDVAGLTAELRGADPQQRRWAARDLAGEAAAAAALCDQLEVEPEASVQEAILTALVDIDDESVPWRLADLLASDDAELRNAVIEALGQMGPRAEPAMAEKLDHADPDLRLFAVNALHGIDGPETRALLVRVLREEPEVNVCAAAAEVLIDVGADEALPALRGLPGRFPDHEFMTFLAETAAARLNDVG